jgi:hypothetical protein
MNRHARRRKPVILFTTHILLQALSNTDCTHTFRPIELGQPIEGIVDAFHAAGVGLLNCWKDVFRKIEVKKGEGLRGGDGLDFFNSGRRLYDELEAVFAAGDGIGLTSPYEIVLAITVGKKHFHISIRLIVDQCEVASPIRAKIETNAFTYEIPLLIRPDIDIKTWFILFQGQNSRERVWLKVTRGSGFSRVPGNGFRGRYLLMLGGASKKDEQRK